MGREISEGRSLKALLIYRDGCSPYINLALKTTRAVNKEIGNI